MILQVNVEGGRDSSEGGKPLTNTRSGFYRIMVLSPMVDELPAYWMFNGGWHFRKPPDLNPPRPWFL